MNDYDIGEAFRKIENELISSMIRNMDNHRAEETKEGIEWTQWQVEELMTLERYKADNRKKYEKQFRSLNAEIEELIRQAKDTGSMDQEIEILEAIKKGFKGFHRASGTMSAQFFALNERKLDALLKAVNDDMEKAETAVLRMANDQYRKAIFNAQVYANSGAGTYEKAVDMATKDMRAAGLNCVEYANGARHTLSDYADMAIRTAETRAYLQGEGGMRQEWGISTVIMNKRGNPCPKCLPWVGKILIDDVWSGGTAQDGPYPLMSTAIAAGLYHPRCKDSHTTYFEGISTPPDDQFTRAELKEIERNSSKEAKQQYYARQAEKYERMAEYSLDADNKRIYAERANDWKGLAKEPDSDIIDLNDEEKYALNQYMSFESYAVNEKLRKDLQLTDREQKMVANLDQALTKLLQYQGDLSRSLYFGDRQLAEEFVQTLKQGETIRFREFISTTSSEQLYNPEGEVQIFIYNAKKGRDLTSFNGRENEILYERNSEFGIKYIARRDGVYYVRLEEK